MTRDRGKGYLWRIAFAICLLAMSSCRTRPVVSSWGSPADTGAPKLVDEATKDLPSDLYKEMPVYPGATIEHVRKPTKAMREILFSTDAQLKTVAEYYRRELTKNGFQVTSALIMPARKTWSCAFYLRGRPGSILLYPDAQHKPRMTIALMYELPAKPNSLLSEPEEVFDLIGPGEASNPSKRSSEAPTTR